MKKTKTSAAITLPSSYQSYQTYSAYNSQQSYKLPSTKTLQSNQDNEVNLLQSNSKRTDNQCLQRKYELLKKQTQLLKQNKVSMSVQLSTLKKILFKNSDMHQVLELQHQKIFELETNLEVMQNKYDKLLMANGSTQQTQLAVKCKQLERRLQERELMHQKQLSTLKAKLMKQNISDLYSVNSANLSNSYSGTNNDKMVSANNITGNGLSPIRMQPKKHI